MDGFVVVSAVMQTARPQADPTKSFNTLWRIYGPTQVWHNKGWRPSEIEMVE